MTKRPNIDPELTGPGRQYGCILFLPDDLVRSFTKALGLIKFAII